MIIITATLAISLPIALWLDHRWGEPRRYHPLVALGAWIGWVERCCYPRRSKARRWHGILGVILVLLPVALISLLTAQLPWLIQSLLGIGVLYLAIGNRSLAEHGGYVLTALQQNDLDEARRKVGWIVSRKTAHLDQSQVIRATIESMLENGNDAVFGALFWFLVGGIPGALLYRVANTLDARWGYKSEKYLHYGWAAARLDDVLNYIPARLCAITYALQGNTIQALRCWRKQAPLCASPNGGPVMSAGAGALGVRLGGPAEYDGYQCDKPILGAGRDVQPADIGRAIALVRRGAWAWGVLATVGTLLAVYLSNGGV